MQCFCSVETIVVYGELCDLQPNLANSTCERSSPVWLGHITWVGWGK
jgi:hypothetical protein